MAGSLRSVEQKVAIENILAALGTYQGSADLIELGAYEKGSQPLLDKMITLKPDLDAFLRQSPGEHHPVEQSWKVLSQLAKHLKGDAHV